MLSIAFLRKHISHEQDTIKCDYRHCIAGIGIAGMGVCFQGGNPAKKKCGRFIDERIWIEKKGEYPED